MKTILIFAILYLLSTLTISFLVQVTVFLCTVGRGILPSAVCKAVHSRVCFVFQMLWVRVVLFILCSAGD